MRRPRLWTDGTARILVVVGVSAAAAALIAAGSPGIAAAVLPSALPTVPSPSSGLQPNGRLLTPAGTQVTLGNYPTGVAVTADGSLAWTVSASGSTNELRIVDLRTNRVCKSITLTGASGGIALDSAHHRAYVSGLAVSRWLPTQAGLPGAAGDTVQVFRWGSTCGSARFDRAIPVPPQPDAPTEQAYPPPRTGLPATPMSWPQRLAVSPDGRRVLVPLNLSNAAAVIDVSGTDAVRYIPAGSYPFGAAITPDSRLGLVTNEAAGTITLVDLKRATAVSTIAAGPPLSHPQGVVVDTSGRRAYVALSASDQVVVINLRTRIVERTIFVGRNAGLGTMPVAVALDPAGDRLYVAQSGSDDVTVVRLPGGRTPRGQAWTVAGRVPTAAQPQAVAWASGVGSAVPRLVYLSAEGLGAGPNPKGPVTTSPTDPIFWAFSDTAPTTDVFKPVQYVPMMSQGLLGLLETPTDAQLRALTSSAAAQVIPSNRQSAPADTVLRPDGPITHVFFIVRENRAYDQVLGDDARGNGDPKLTLFGAANTPNLHALVQRFPLLDSVYANSEASVQGHYWTGSAGVPDYVTRNWIQEYGGRGRPNDFGSYAVSWPGNGFIFNQADRQGISYFNYGEAFIGGYPSVPDRDRTPAILAAETAVMAKSDLGPPFGGCYPGDQTIGTAMDNGEIFDSSMPSGAPAGSYSHVDCFRERFASQLATNTVPALSYLSMTSDHTRGTQPGYPIPQAMVADSDLGVGQIIDTISHSPIWASSVVFVVEDDSQDGADHVDAHRIPVLVASPYARAGAVVHTRYDLVSVVRSIELILGMDPLTLNDALATPMYDAFSSTPANLAPVTAITPQIDLLERNTTAAPDSPWSARLALDKPDQVSQADLDAILWHAVHGAGSTPPPPGPGAEGEDPGD